MMGSRKTLDKRPFAKAFRAYKAYRAYTSLHGL